MPDLLGEMTQLLDLAHDAILVRDLGDRVTYWNQGAVECYGWSKEEALGQVTHVLLRTEFPEPLDDIRARLVRDGRWEGELTHTRRDGARLVVASRWALRRDDRGNPAAVLEINRDITPRKQAEAALRRANADLEQRVARRTAALALARSHLEAVLNTVHEGIVAFDNGADVIFCNDAEARIAGFDSPQDMLRNLAFFAERFVLTDPAGRVVPVGAWPVSRVLRGESFTDWECHGRRTDTGQEWDFSFSGSPVRDEEGRQVLAVVVTRDVTAAKRAEQEVRRQAQELEERVEERTRELQEANAALEAFAYSVSHDLRTPLRNMQALAQALEEDYADRLEEGGRDFCQRIIQSARKMDRLILDLLAYSRLSRGDLPRGRVDLGGVVAEAEAALADVLHESRGRVTVEGPLPPVVGHRGTLVQVVTNLLANALKFVAPGVVPEVRVRAEGRGGCVRLWVEDNGIGIAPEHRQRVFNVFERLHGEESYPGTGIGLAIVRKGVERSGGRVGVESGAGRGSRFWLELPRPEGE